MVWDLRQRKRDGHFFFSYMVFQAMGEVLGPFHLDNSERV